MQGLDIRISVAAAGVALAAELANTIPGMPVLTDASAATAVSDPSA